MKRFFKKLGFKWQFYYWLIMLPCLLILLGLDIFLIVDYSKYAKKTKLIDREIESTELSEDLVIKQEKDNENDKPLYLHGNSEEKTEIDGVVCWGDSLTAGKISLALFDNIVNSYPYKVERLIMTENGIDVPVYNKGVSGETSITICGRSGAIPYITDKAIKIPTEKTEIPISFKSSLGEKRVDPLRYTLTNQDGIQEGNETMVSINGIRGTLRVEQISGAVPEHEYYFCREEEGNEIDIAEGMEIVFEDAEKFKSCIPVIYMGTNGGFDDFDGLIYQIDAIIKNQATFIQDKYVVIGLHSGEYIGKSKQEIAELDEIMREHYGNHYLSIFEAMCDEKGLTELGLEVTDEDREMISNKEVPYCVVADKDLDRVHFKDEGYTLLAMKVYDKMNELGYIEELIEQH